MKKIKKRGAVYGVVALLLCTAAYLNWSYVEPPADLLQTVIRTPVCCISPC